MSLFKLNDKVVVVTGGVGLLGKEHVYAIASHGGIPVILDINKNKISKLVKNINKDFNIECSGFVTDITNEEDIILSSKKILSKYKKIDALINNAANNPSVNKSISKDFSRLENFKISQWETDISVGLTGSFLCSKVFGKILAKNKHGGSIINISSDLGLISPDQRLYKKNNLNEELQPVKPISYSVIKSGLIGMTKYLATYWAEKNVRCNAICPGGIENNQDKDFIKSVSSLIPLNRLAKSSEYQSTIIWMLSDSTNYLNGSVISIDGGRTAW